LQQFISASGRSSCPKHPRDWSRATTDIDLGQVEDVVDEREKMASCAEHAVERLGILLRRGRSRRVGSNSRCR
jgi:hypothetical protein